MTENEIIKSVSHWSFDVKGKSMALHISNHVRQVFSCLDEDCISSILDFLDGWSKIVFFLAITNAQIKRVHTLKVFRQGKRVEYGSNVSRGFREGSFIGYLVLWNNVVFSTWDDINPSYDFTRSQRNWNSVMVQEDNENLGKLITLLKSKKKWPINPSGSYSADTLRKELVQVL
jgi:hypothetical protein